MVIGPREFGMRGLGFGAKVSVAIPKPVTEFIKTVPELRAEAKGYVRQAETQASRVTAAFEAGIVAAQTIAVVGVFGIIVAALLMRERKK